jgi:hypothetical protein
MVAAKKIIVDRKELCQVIHNFLEHGYADIEIHAPKCPHKDRYGLDPNLYLVKAFNKRLGVLSKIV